MHATAQHRSRVVTDVDGPSSRLDRLRAAVARLGGDVDWRVDSNGWIVTLHLPEERLFVAATLEAALSACVVWLTPDVPEAGVRRQTY